MRNPTPSPACPALQDIALTDVLGALSDPTRLAIVARLSKSGSEHGWGELDVGVCKSTLSHHIKVLREAGLIHYRKTGTRCHISIRRELDGAFPGLLDQVLRLAEADPHVDCDSVQIKVGAF